jgi:hypothetical protein
LIHEGTLMAVRPWLVIPIHSPTYKSLEPGWYFYDVFPKLHQLFDLFGGCYIAKTYASKHKHQKCQTTMTFYGVLTIEIEHIQYPTPMNYPLPYDILWNILKYHQLYWLDQFFCWVNLFFFVDQIPIFLLAWIYFLDG